MDESTPHYNRPLNYLNYNHSNDNIPLVIPGNSHGHNLASLDPTIIPPDAQHNVLPRPFYDTRSYQRHPYATSSLSTPSVASTASTAHIPNFTDIQGHWEHQTVNGNGTIGGGLGSGAIASLGNRGTWMDHPGETPAQVAEHFQASLDAQEGAAYRAQLQSPADQPSNLLNYNYQSPVGPATEDPLIAYTAHALPNPPFRRPLTGFANVQHAVGSNIASSSILQPAFAPPPFQGPSRHSDNTTSNTLATRTLSAGRTVSSEGDRKRRLTDSAPGGREEGSNAPTEVGASRPRMSEPSSIVDLTSPPQPTRRDRHNSHGRRTSGAGISGNPLERRRPSLNAGLGGAMRVDDSAGQAGDSRTHTNTFTPPSNPMDASGAASSDLVLPRWQPDGEVNKCPVCGNQFGFFYRKHHCRKCGRVVCATCSPHRITMPHQYIVQPPQIIDLTAEDGDVSPQQTSRYANPALGGGAQVRVCNPCVPDPNYSPPPRLPPAYDASTLPTHLQNNPNWSTTSLGDRTVPRGSFFPQSLPQQWMLNTQYPQGLQGRSGGQGSSSTDPFREGQVRFDNPSSTSDLFPPFVDNRQRHPSVLDAPLPPPPTSRPPRPQFTPYFPNHLAAPRTSSRAHRPHHSTDNFSPAFQHPLHDQLNAQYRSLLDPGNTALPGSAPPFQSLPGGFRGAGRPLPSSIYPRPAPPPSRQIAEEDECPVCGNELPPKGPNDEETERERHVEECIASHFTPSGPSRTSGTTDDNAERVDPTLPQNFPAGSASSVPTLPSSGNPLARPRGNTANAPSMDSPSAPIRQRRSTGNRMLIYTATEKDCVGDEPDGERAECIICFEEFEPGVELGRLECLCKFHRGCIRQWWDTKGVGSCPTHQLHD